MAIDEFDRLSKALDEINRKLQTLQGEITQTQDRVKNLGNTGNLTGLRDELALLDRLQARYRRLDLERTSTTRDKSKTVDPSGGNRLENVVKGVGVEQQANEIAKRVLKQQKDLLENAKANANALSSALNQYDEFANSYRQRQSSNRTAGGAYTIPGGTPRSEQGMPDETSAGWEEAESNAQRIERERIEALAKNIRAIKKYTQALEIAEAQGYNIDKDLKNVKTRGTGGIEQLQFRRKDEMGINKELDLYVNPNGKATPGLSNQFRSFGQGVVRDIGELTKWSIALAAVYGPLQKVQELVQVMIQNQSKLAEATTAVSSSFLGQSEIFDTAAEAADRAGESVGGVIDAFTQAYRAAGGGGNEVERFSTATKLLSDALTLSKLSTLDQAQAIDTLAAAVRQTGGDFDKTTQLLDSWVRVTKVANVDLTTLATGFAVLGDAAETAGIDANELNGLIAVIAESSQSSGKEVANAARAIVSGLQSDQGVRALEELGIATKDTEGNLRNLQEVLVEVSSLRDLGIISDTQLSRLSGQIGGGSRRGAIVATVFENYSRALQVADESSRASGDAQAALAKQLETVQTAIERLGNSFQGLAQSLGTEGGLLGIITGSVDGMTILVKTFDNLVSILGKATPAMAAFVATSLILKSRGQGGIQQALFGAGKDLQTPNNRGIGLLPPIAPQQQQNQGLRSFVGTNVLGSNLSSGIAQGLGIALIPALLNATNKDDRFGKTKAGADILGGVGGAIVGTLVGAGPIVGATIGTAISEAFVNSTIARKTDIFGYANQTGLGESFNEPVTDNLDAALQQAEIALYESIGYGSEALGKILTSGMINAATMLVDQINEAIEEGDIKRVESLLAGTTLAGKNSTILEQAGIDESLVRSAAQNRKPIEFTPERAIYDLASTEAQRGYDSAYGARTAEGDVKEIATPFKDLISQNKANFGELLDGIKQSTRDQISEQRLSGDLKGSEYARKTTALGGSDAKALQYYTALGNQVSSIGSDANTAAGAFAILNEVIVNGATDAIPEITAINGEIEKLINILNDPAIEESVIENLYGGAEEAQARLEELRITQANLIKDVYAQSQLDKLKIPSIDGDVNKPFTSGEEGLIEKRTKELQDPYYKEFLQLPDDMYNALKEGWEAFAVAVKDSGDLFYKKVEETDPQFRQAAIADLMEQGLLGSQQTTPYGIQQIDMTSQEGAGLQGSIDYFSQYLSSNFPQYEQNPEEFGVIFNDYVTSTLHGDNLAVQLALQKLIDVNQKQLDGQYNIPEGATFWVPLTAAYYRPQSQDGGIGGGTIDTKPLDDSANNLDQAAMNLSSAADLFKESQMRGAQIAEGMGVGGKEGRDRGPYTSGGLRYGRPQYEDIHPTDHQDRFDKMNAAYNPGTEDLDSTIGSFIDKLKTGLQSLFRITESVPGMDRFGTQGGDVGGGGGRTGGRVPETSVNQVTSAKLDLRIDNTTQLMVDGRVLASIITPFLAQDLLRLEASAGTITRRYVI